LAVGFLFLLAIVVALGGLQMMKPRSESAQPPAGDAFAQDRDPAAPQVVPFDAQRAMSYLEAVCRIGPRISGSGGMKQQQELLKKHFETHGGKVAFQRFTVRQVSQRGPVEMANTIVSWHPERPRRVIFCAHYDTRPVADQEPDRRDWNKPFVSANDGGSGVALLMELAHHMKDVKTHVGVDFVFFDGEEYVFEPERDRYFFGSQHFAETWRKNQARPHYLAAVLLDMVGGKGARFPVEGHSFIQAGALVQSLWRVAAEQQCSAFEERVGTSVLDDHLALNQAGIPAVDIIDFDYPHWHRLSDVPANCSGDSLAQVARVLTAWVQRVR
jgi:glutaminyl-peptide cyclotransferase